MHSLLKSSSLCCWPLMETISSTVLVTGQPIGDHANRSIFFDDSVIAQPYKEDIKQQRITELIAVKPLFDLHVVSSLPIVHACESTKMVTVTRQHGDSFIASTISASPYSSSTPTALNSRAPTPISSKEFNNQGDILSRDHFMK